MFFTPRHIKEGKHYRHALKRLKDILPEKELVALRDLLAKLKLALKSRKQDQIYAVAMRLNELWGALPRR
jgi:hypothetical protein